MACVAAALFAVPADADDLYKRGSWTAMSADLKAMAAGDVLTVVVYQSAESTQSTKSNSGRSTDLSGRVTGGALNEGGGLNIGGSYSGGGQVQRSERFVTQMSVTVDAVLPNGDLRIAGRQRMHVNGEWSDIGIRGRVRVADIAGDNSVASSRLADAEIDYNGHGFVSRSAKPGLINSVFRFLGLG